MPRHPHRNHVHRFPYEDPAAQPFQLLPQRQRKPLQLQLRKGLAQRQPRLMQQPGDAALLPLRPLAAHQVIEEGLMGQPRFGGLQRQRFHRVGHRWQPQAVQQGQQVGVTVQRGHQATPSRGPRHGESPSVTGRLTNWS